MKQKSKNDDNGESQECDEKRTVTRSSSASKNARQLESGTFFTDRDDDGVDQKETKGTASTNIVSARKY